MAQVAEIDSDTDECDEWTKAELIESLRDGCRVSIEQYPSWCGLSKDDHLTRWLIARKGDIEAASKSLTRHIQWRTEKCDNWFPGRLPPLDPVSASIESGKARIIGKIAETNAPLLYIDVEKHDCYKIDESETRSYVVCMIEHVIALSDMQGGNGQFAAVFDVGGLGWNSADTSAVGYISLMLAANYPERLQSLFIVNEGVLFWSLWAIAKAFMDQRTLDKVMMLGATDRLALIEAVGGEHNLIESLGGTMDGMYDPEAARKELDSVSDWHVKRCAEAAAACPGKVGGGATDDGAAAEATATGLPSDDSKSEL